MKTTLPVIFFLLSFTICSSQELSKSEAQKKKQEVKNQIKSFKIQKRTAVLQGQLDSQKKEYVLQPNESVNYSANVLTSNFSIPLARFNFTGNSDNTKNGEILLFNSIGAGVSFNHGIYTATTNGNSEIVNHEFVNIIGIQGGFLFSAGTGEDTKNVFAPVVNVVVLDFQLGFGWELGTIKENQKRGFLTLSYAIPMYKLSRTGFYILNKRFKDKDKPLKTDEAQQLSVSQSGASSEQVPEQTTKEQTEAAEASRTADAKASEARSNRLIALSEETRARTSVDQISDEVNNLTVELSSYQGYMSELKEIGGQDSESKSKSKINQEIINNIGKLQKDLGGAKEKLAIAKTTLEEAQKNAANKNELYRAAAADARIKAKAKADAEIVGKLKADPNATTKPAEAKPAATAPLKTNPNSSGFLKL